MITVYDTATGSLNIGDTIIMDAAMYELEKMFSDEHFVLYPTHYALARSTLNKAWNNNLGFVCGTNLLRNYWRWRARKNQWSVSFLDAFKMQPAILFGVGWNVYGDETEWKAKVFYKNALRKDILHSVRDSYTERKLKDCGVENVINTGCPTLWGLSDTKISAVATEKSTSVVFTLTDYRQDSSLDTALINTLTNNYSEVYFWPQGSEDLAYFQELLKGGIHNADIIKLIPSHLSAFNDILKKNKIDYVGTRLHAGIRALQLSKRSIIIGVDNRAIEMKEDINLPVVNRASVEELNQLINSSWRPSLNIPWREIQQWKSQFESISLSSK
jgi:polysaccharide pyruvyl transferase WcaK-like protein